MAGRQEHGASGHEPAAPPRPSGHGRPATPSSLAGQDRLPHLPADDFRVERPGPRWWPHGLFLTAALLVLAGVSIPLTNILLYTPERTVKAYLEAVAKQDADDALALLGLTADPESTLLSEEVLAAAASLPSAIRIEDTVRHQDGTAEVTASFLLDSATHSLTLPLRRADTGWLPYEQWQIDVEALPTLDISVDGSPTAQVNEQLVSVEGDPIEVLFPVSYLVDFDSAWFTAQAERSAVIQPGETASLRLTAEPTESLTREVERQLGTFLETCAQGTTLAPAGCPFQYRTDNEILDEVHWEVTEPPRVTLGRSEERLAMPATSGTAEVRGRERDIVTGEERDFEVPVEFFLGAEVTVLDGAVLVAPRDAGLEQN